jgi:protein involved in ribonucleotide reduction
VKERPFNVIQKVNIVYISLTGNTKDFIQQLDSYFTNKNINLCAKNIKDTVSSNQPFECINEPFATFLPSFLEGGNGIENGYKEILTTPLKEYLMFNDNYLLCYGIVGSGNRNFNKQFGLTAKQYSKHFGFPYIDEFELRGTFEDVKRIGEKLIRLQSIANMRKKG